jgi:hypothetical protein
VLAESRMLKSGGAAGVATIGTASVEVAQQLLAEPQGAILLVPDLDTMRWHFIAKSCSPESRWRSTCGSTTGGGAAVIAGSSVRVASSSPWARAAGGEQHRTAPRSSSSGLYRFSDGGDGVGPP